jgi:hypothetical protein
MAREKGRKRTVRRKSNTKRTAPSPVPTKSVRKPAAGYDHGRCRKLFLRSLVVALSEHVDLVRDLEAKHRTNFGSGLRAISFDVLPWQPFIALSFRTAADIDHEIRWSPADDTWTGYELIGWHNAANVLGPPMEYVHNVHQHEADDPARCKEVCHLIYMAAAESLLDPSVARLLQKCNVPAGIIRDRIPCSVSPAFEYVVVDEDRVFNGNYCEFICATRVARRLSAQ